MPNSEITEVVPLPPLSSPNSIPQQITMGQNETMLSQEINHLIPSKLLMPSPDQEEVGNCPNVQIRKCLDQEITDFNIFNEQSSDSITEYLFPPNKSGSSDLFDYSPCGPFSLNRSLLYSSSLISYCVSIPVCCATSFITSYLFNQSCNSIHQCFFEGIYKSVRFSLDIPFLIAGSALQSSICLIPCLATNALNFATSKQYDSLNIAASTSMLFFSNGTTFEDHLKILRKIYPNRNFSIEDNSLFNEIFFKFDENDFPSPEQNNHLDSFKCFLNKPALYLDDVTTEQSHFFQGKLEKENLTRIISSISDSERPIIGRIDRYNKILFAFAFNCLVFNFLSDVEEKYPELIVNKSGFDAIKDSYRANILEFKNHIKKYVYDQVGMQDYESKLEDFFNICDNYYGKLETLPAEQQALSMNEQKILICGYEKGREKFNQQIANPALSTNSSANSLLPQAEIILRGDLSSNSTRNPPITASAQLVFIH